MVKEAGYKYAVTTDAGVNNLERPYSLKRINVWEGTSLSVDRNFSKGYFAYKLMGLW